MREFWDSEHKWRKGFQKSGSRFKKADKVWRWGDAGFFPHCCCSLVKHEAVLLMGETEGNGHFGK